MQIKHIEGTKESGASYNQMSHKYNIYSVNIIN